MKWHKNAKDSANINPDFAN